MGGHGLTCAGRGGLEPLCLARAGRGGLEPLRLARSAEAEPGELRLRLLRRLRPKACTSERGSSAGGGGWRPLELCARGR